jgi:hypothetical protein
VQGEDDDDEARDDAQTPVLQKSLPDLTGDAAEEQKDDGEPGVEGQRV